MDANDLTFGVEIETHIPAGAVQVGAYHVGNSIPGFPAGWTAQHDGSIHCEAGREGCEFVSPILKGADGVKQVVEVVAKLNAMEAKVNASTGVHIHVGWIGDAKALDRLISSVANCEKAIFAATGTKSREHNHYCGGIRRYGNVSEARNNARNYRYHMLNLTNLHNPSKQTIEFRAFSGTTNATKIVGYIRLCLGLIEKALNAKKAMQFISNPPAVGNSVYRSGEGQTQLARVFYALGWTKGRTNHVFGNVVADNVPDMEAVKKELMRLARKYDGEPTETVANQTRRVPYQRMR